MSPCVAGHSSLPLSTTVLPQASGTATARTPRITGAFHGAMPSTTPAACRVPIARLPGTFDGMTSPLIWVVSAAASTSMSAAKCTLKPAQMPEAPISEAMAAVKSAALASRDCAALSSSARRSPGAVCDQAGKAAAAASTAATASCGVAAGAVVATSPSSGLVRVKVTPLLAARAWPLISMVMVLLLMSCLLVDVLGVQKPGAGVRQPPARSGRGLGR